MLVCPCGSGMDIVQCCQPFINGLASPNSCEQLMRSRYSAFALGDANYLWQSQHPDFRPADKPTPLDDKQASQWQGLDILFSCDCCDGIKGIVEFKAYYREQGQLHVLHERSNFTKIGDHWFYTDGLFSPAPLARKAPCPCGSGKKLKQCCSKS